MAAPTSFSPPFTQQHAPRALLPPPNRYVAQAAVEAARAATNAISQYRMPPLHFSTLDSAGPAFHSRLRDEYKHEAQHEHEHEIEDFGPAVGQDNRLSARDDHRTAPLVDSPSAEPYGRLCTRIVVDPPDLQAWRERLFNVDDAITLTNEQFETYFPHVDNVYSHRSTQRYKRKPFISHYWDCRMKGRPPGTPKSDDPNKKKRKRNVRGRDLCDVKIKITEHFSRESLEQLRDTETSGVIQPERYPAGQHTLGPPPSGRVPPGKYWTIQRVNGNGGNGKGDGIAGPHKHTLARSDGIKKNSVQRYLATQAKESTKPQTKPAPEERSRRPPSADGPKHSQRPSGAALQTSRRHAEDRELKLYAASFCPFSQRVWIALEAKGLSYQYCEIDPHQKPAPSQLLEANPRGLVPAIRQGDWACAESGVILEYLEDIDVTVPMYPSDPRLKANCRLWIDHINSRIVPDFFAVLCSPDVPEPSRAIDQLQANLRRLVLAADEKGPFFLGSDLCLVDVHFAPFAIRFSRVLEPKRRWTDPVPGTRWRRWLDALEGNPHVKATTSAKELYLDTADVLAQRPMPSR